MFSSTNLFVAVLGLAVTAPLTAALSGVQVLESPVSGGPMTITWSSEPSDGPFTLSLFSTNPSYNGGFAIANNLNPADNKAVISLPDVIPGGGYTICFVDLHDTGKVYASSGSFIIGAAPTTTSSHPPPRSVTHLASMPSATFTASPMSGVETVTASLHPSEASMVSAAHSMMSAASVASSAARSGASAAALPLRVPRLAAALVLSGMLLGAWAV
ncbi:hypothetical protein C8J57DRAFT_1282130 [Mycena rebaudengoi]|nr:hypothetical protein C8J57DRAFT_1282130 [Mycena rebaudengoi]